MSWQSPTALWLGLTLGAIALLWLLRPRRPRSRVPSLMLWPASPATRRSARPWQRLRSHPLLWLQLAAAALLALAAPRPFLPAAAASEHVVVFLDASGSMRARDAGDRAGDRFAAARQAALDLARRLGPGQRLSLVRVDAEPRVLLTGAARPEAVEAALAAEEASHGPPDLAAALALGQALTDGPAEWVLVGDGGLTVPEGLRRPTDVAFRHLLIGAPAANVAVTALVARQAGRSVALQAGLRATGPAPASGRLQLYADDRLVGARDWQLEAGGETQVTWTGLPADGDGASGPRRYEARLAGLSPEANALDDDDRAWAVLAEPVEPGVLLVSPGSTFLDRVLAVHGGLRPYRAAPADWPGVAAGASYPLTIFDRLWPDPFPRGSALVVGPPIGEEFRPGRIWPRADHPLLRHVDWSEVSVAAARRLPLEGGWETLVDSDRGPLLSVRTEGGRRQAALAFDLGRSDLPLRPAFPILIANLLDWLAPRPDAAPRAVAPGQPAAVEAAPLAREVWVESPSGAREQLAPPWPPRQFRPPAPGLYRVVQTGDGLHQEQLLVVDGYAAAEADLAPRRLDIPAAGAPAGPAPLQPRDALALWPWLLVALLALSTVEWWVDARAT